jgi:hypothetical protein
MVSADHSDRWRKVVLISLGILVLIIILITLFVGLKSLKTFFVWLIGIALFLVIIFGLAYIFWLLFLKKTFKDIPATYRKKLLSVAKLMKNEMLGDLYLSGDVKHNRIKLGKFYYMRLTLPRQIRQTIDNPEQRKKLQGTQGKPSVMMPDGTQAFTDSKGNMFREWTEPVPIDAFFIIKKGMMDKLFGSPMVVLVKPQDHDYSSIFNDVTLRGFNLAPLDSQFYTINSRDIDIDIIKGVAQNYIRETVYEIFRDLDRLVKQAMNLDQQFQKEKQRGMEFEIPQMSMMGGGGTGGQNK